jgi:hypothetical protein
MKTAKEFVADCATAVVELFAQNIADPSAKEIAVKVYGDDQYVSQGMIEDVRKKLNKIRAVLAEDEYQTCALGGLYYRKFRGPKRRPQTRDEARRCCGGKQEGILGLGVDTALDIIWRESKSWQANSGASKIGRALSDVRTAVDNGRLPEDNGHQIVDEAGRLAQLKSVESPPQAIEAGTAS